MFATSIAAELTRCAPSVQSRTCATDRLVPPVIDTKRRTDIIETSTAHPAQDLWPDVHTVRQVDDLLRKRWLQDFQPDAAAIKKLFPDIDDALRRFEEAEQKAVAKAGPQGIIDERELFRLLAHPGVFAYKAVARR